MADFAQARRTMVDGQVRIADVTDPRILAAMGDIGRERFVPAAKAPLAYLDLDVPVREGPARYLLKPMVLAKMIQAADVRPDDRILDVGCATGYSSALLAHLGHAVVALEEDRDLAAAATRALADVANVSVVTGMLRAGWPAGAPYDVIMVNGATEIAPEALLSQLRDGGRLVCVRGGGPAGKAALHRMDGGDVSTRPIFDAAAPLLPGFARPVEFVF